MAAGWAAAADDQISDVIPPELVDLAIDPAIVDIESGDASTTVTLSITDDLSGARYYQSVRFHSPSGAQYHYTSGYLVSGTELDGEWEVNFTFPEHSELGIWTISVRLEDEVGNYSWIDSETLDALGFPTEVEVVSVPDTDPPVLTQLSIDSSSIDTSEADQSLIITVAAADNPSGVDYMFIYMRNPSGTVMPYVYVSERGLIGGTTLDGTWQTTFTIPQYSESGIWTVSRIYLRDNAANWRYIYESDLQSMGLNVQVAVTSDQQDTSPPEILDLNITPIFINTARSSAEVTVSLELTDDLSGVDSRTWPYYHVLLRSPSGGQRRYSQLDLAPVAGTPMNGTWQAHLFFPQYSEDGTWRIDYLDLFDETGNRVRLYTADLAAKNLPVELIVVKPIQDIDGSITDPDAGGDVIDDTFGDRAKITVPPDVLTGPTDIAIDVFMDPLDLPTPSGFAAPGTRFVNIEFVPEPSFPLPAPGLTVVLPLPSPIPAGTSIQLFRVDPDTGNLVAAIGVDGLPVFGSVDPGNLSVTFIGVARMSTVVGLIAPAIKGDLNFDGCVDREDYLALMSNIRSGGPFNSLFDLNGDGAVNRADARTLVGLFTNPRGASCP